MRFRLGFVSGFAAGYYLGAKAGRQRYDEINRMIRKVQGSDAYETAKEKAKEASSVASDKARQVMSTAADKVGDLRHGDGEVTTSPSATATPTVPDPWPESPRP